MRKSVIRSAAVFSGLLVAAIALSGGAVLLGFLSFLAVTGLDLLVTAKGSLPVWAAVCFAAAVIMWIIVLIYLFFSFIKEKRG